MSKRIAVLVLVALAGVAGLAFAQQVQGGQAKPAEQATAAAAARPEPPGINANVKLDLTIADQTGSGEPLKKVVTMLVADRGMGSIRSNGTARNQGRVQINVDARPTIVPNSQLVRVTLGFEYTPRALGQEAAAEWSSVSEQFTVVLEAGKPVVISQAADPASDRKITVEVRATILK